MIGWRLARLRKEQSGVTIPEVTIALSVMLLVAGAFLSVVISLQANLVRQQRRSENNDQARLAIEQLDREIRSGNVLYNPATEADPYYGLRIYTQANAPTRTPSFQCVQWLIEDDQLKRRSWPPNQPELAGSWRVVAEGIVNRTLGEEAFQLDPEPSKGNRTVMIKLTVNGDLPDDPAATIRIQTSLTGRNTSLGFSSDVCADLPAS
ncbi:MAG TPA: hypothetical protein VF097_02025 [Actinomycetota bacterium]